MACMTPESAQFCEDIDRLIWEEENRMNNVHNNENSGDESRNNDPKPTKTQARKKKIYQRYTFEQLQRLHEVFEKKSHPDEKERAALGIELGLSPDRVMFWFQNRRSQTKKLTDKELHQRLKEENENLRADNIACTHALLCAKCEKCNGCTPDDVIVRNLVLRVENAYIRDEIRRFKCMLRNHYVNGAGPSVVHNFPTSSVGSPYGHSGLASASFEAESELNAEEMFNWKN